MTRKKLLEIDDCDDCKHVSYSERWGWWRCELVDRNLDANDVYVPIPDWCPLQDTIEEDAHGDK